MFVAVCRSTHPLTIVKSILLHFHIKIKPHLAPDDIIYIVLFKQAHIVLFAAIAIIILLIVGVFTALSWSLSWNPNVTSLMLNLIAGLLEIIIGILVALFIVEKYLEHQRNEKGKVQLQQEKLRNEYWQALLGGGLDIIAVNLVYVCLYFSYGKDLFKDYTEKMFESLEIPNTVSSFIPFLIYQLYLATDRRAKSDSSKEERSRQDFDDPMANKLKRIFEEKPAIASKVDTEDLLHLRNILKMDNHAIRDHLFLIQPFLPERLSLGAMFIQISYDIMSAIEELDHLLNENGANKGRTILLDSVFKSKYAGIGCKAIEIITDTWDYAKHASGN